MRWWCWCRGDDGGKAPQLQETLKSWPVVCGQLYRSMASLVLELHWRRGGVGGMAPPLLEKFKMVVESWGKMLWGVT